MTKPKYISLKPSDVPEIHRLVNGSIREKSLTLRESWKRVAIGVDHDRLYPNGAEPHLVLCNSEARTTFAWLGDGRRIHEVPVELLPQDVQETLGPEAILQK